MGTVLVWPRLSMSVSLVKTSVMGFLEYVSAKQGNFWQDFSLTACILAVCELSVTGEWLVFLGCERPSCAGKRRC